MNKPILYVLCPGTVVSEHDGERHFLSSEKLFSLYGLKRSERVTLGELDKHLLGRARKKLKIIYLRPKRNGNYKLPTS